MRFYTRSFLFLVILFAVSCGNNEGTPVAKSTGNADLDKINEALRKSPNDTALLFQRAKIYYEAAAYDEAIADMKTLLGKDSINTSYLHQLADVYLDYNQSRLALTTMEYAAAAYPEKIPTLLKLCEFQYLLQFYDQGLATVGRIRGLDPQNAEAYFMAGRIFFEQGEDDRAIENLQKAVDIDPDIDDAWIKLGQLFAKKKNPIAIRYFNTAILKDSTNLPARLERANYFWKNENNASKALGEYRQIIKMDPQYADALYNTGLVYLEQDSTNQAYKHFDMAVKVEPMYAKAYLYRAKTASLLKKPKEFIVKDYQQVLALDTSVVEAKKALIQLGVDPG